MDAIVLDFGSGDDAVEGECQLEGEVGKIMCLSFSHGVTMPMSWDVANMKRTIGKSQHNDFTITKKVDIASPKLNFYASVGREFAEVKVRVYQADGEDDFVLYQEFALTEAVMSEMSTEGGGEDSAVETINFNFTKIKWLYKKQLADVGQEGQSAYEFDLKAAKGAAA